MPPMKSISKPKAYYESANEAVNAVHEGYSYWTGKLTDTSLQLSYAVIAANWAAFGSVDAILRSFWSKLSISLVVIGLGLSVMGAKFMGEWHRRRTEYALSDPARWNTEFAASVRKYDSWPFTQKIEFWGRAMREAKTWLPVVAGFLFIVALYYHRSAATPR
jgi:hypothetical protein